MAIALARNHGTSDLSGSGTTITKQPTATIPVGNHVVMVVRAQTASLTVSAADTQGNTYQVDLTANADVRATYVISAKITTQLTTADTITVTYSGSAAQRTMGLSEWSGMAASSWVDQSTSATGSSTSPDSGNVTTTQADELLLGAFGYNTAGGAFTVGTNYTALNNVQNQGAVSWLASEYRIVSSTGTYSASGTITSTNWTAVIVTYKAAAGGAVVERSVSIDATAAMTTAGTFWTTFERSVAVSATAAIATAGQRDLLRSASLTATVDISTTAQFWSVLERSASLDAAAQIVVAGQRELLRSASLEAQAAIATAAIRELLRSVSLTATAVIEASGTTGARQWTYNGTPTATYGGTADFTYDHTEDWHYTPVTG